MINTVILGDCLDVMNQIPDKSVDMVLCDLPYQITACKWDSLISVEPLWGQYSRVCKGAIVLTSSQPFTSILVMSNPTKFKHEWIWVKNRGSNFLNTKTHPMKEHESVLVFAYDKYTYNPQKQERSQGGKDRSRYVLNPHNKEKEVYGGFLDVTAAYRPTETRVPGSVQRFNTEVGLHPTQKPVALFEYLIRTYSNENDVVLDNCIGSGTTAIAAIKTNRRFIGIEKDPQYVDMSNKRIAAFRESEMTLPFMEDVCL